LAILLAQTAAPAPAKPAAAAPPTKATIEAQVKANFAKVDANHDGKVDRAESDKFHATAAAAQDARRKQVLASAFDKLDSDKNGQISRKEFDAANPQRAATKNAWFDANDIDKNGKVEINEAMAKAQRNFEMLDKDNNGVLSAQEINSRGRRTASAPSSRN
jgi:hypothetical protein